MQFFVVTYEFIFSPFSGNGILARSLVNSLLGLGHFVSVWCTQPNNSATTSREALIQQVFPHHNGRLQIISNTVDESKWKCLDENSAWETFAFANSDETTQTELLLLFGEDSTSSIIPVVIDWHGSHAYQTLPLTDRVSPLVYMNFRVYAAGIADEKRHDWLNQMERKALASADKVVALSQHDRDLLQQLANEQDGGGIDKEFEVFYPPLRKDIQELGGISELLPLPESVPDGKQFVACVVRLSPEKETSRFVPFLESIRDLMESKGWIPLLVGSPSDQAYAKAVREQLKDAFPDSIDLVGNFLSPQELCSIFQRTVINFHPCSYDAYGMTIVEAAAMGVPSVIANNGQVGASHLIGEDAFIPTDVEAIQSADKEALHHLRTILQDDVQLRPLGELARERALAWNEVAYGSRLVALASSTDPASVFKE